MRRKLAGLAGLAMSVSAGVCLIASFFALKSPVPFARNLPDARFAREAMYWEPMDLGVKCLLCPFNCYLTEGAKGHCRVRMNRDGTVYTQVYGQPVALAVDPIEKKPVFHMLPGSPILSLSTVGCPLRCGFCQNWSISQAYPEKARQGAALSPDEIVGAAVERGVPSIAYTYGEPAVFYEYMLETARLAKRRGLRNVVVTSGYINSEPLRKLAPYLDVVKVDLKGMSEEFYARDVGGRLESVLDTLRLLKELKVMVEVVNLVVPTRNDSDEDIKRLAEWVRENLGPDCPVFFSRFHPDYRFGNLPPTPVATLEKAVRIARRAGLNFVYIGNVPGHDAENTYCPNDGTILVRRRGFLVDRVNLKDGRCPACGRRIPGVWN